MSSGCGDVLSLADLQTAKKHQIFEAEVITGLQGGVVGGAPIDYATNQITGQVQKTLPAILRDTGFEPASFDFTIGGTLGVNDRDKVVYDPVSKTWYSWGGALPHVIAAGTNPVGNADWTPQTDPNIRDYFLQSNGSDFGYKFSALTATTQRTVQDKLDEYASLFDFHCDASGTKILPGPSVDSAPYFQKAIDALAEKGGGVLYIPNGVWYFSSMQTGNVCVWLKDNITIIGAPGATVKLDYSYFVDKAFTVFQGYVQSAPLLPRNKVVFTGQFVIDFSSVPMPVYNYYRAGINLGNAYDCLIEGVTFKNGDVTWAIIIGDRGYGDRNIIRNCSFIDLIQDLPSSAINDHSSVYVNAPNSHVLNCNFQASSNAAAIYACCVELHQTNTSWADGGVQGYCRGAFLAKYDSESLVSYANYGSKISGISGYVHRHFVSITSASTSSGTEPTIEHAIISDNSIRVLTKNPANTYLNTFIFISEVDGLPKETLGLEIFGNYFFASSNTGPLEEKTPAIKIAGVVRYLHVHGNTFDCPVMLRTVKAQTPRIVGLVWEENNVIGYSYNGNRANSSLFELRASTEIVNCSIKVRQFYKDNSMYAVIVIDTPTCANSMFYVHPHNCKDSGVVIEATASQLSDSTNYFSYPETINFTTAATAGTVRCYSSSGSYSWVARADVIGGYSFSDITYPSSFTSKGSELSGIAWNDTANIRSASIRVQLNSK